MMKADRNGFFFVLNRETGKLLSAEKYVPTTWADRYDVATGQAGGSRRQASWPGTTRPRASART
jgi:glucose dehydrogenase